MSHDLIKTAKLRRQTAVLQKRSREKLKALRKERSAANWPTPVFVSVRSGADDRQETAA